MTGSIVLRLSLANAPLRSPTTYRTLEALISSTIFGIFWWILPTQWISRRSISSAIVISDAHAKRDTWVRIIVTHLQLKNPTRTT